MENKFSHIEKRKYRRKPTSVAVRSLKEAKRGLWKRAKALDLSDTGIRISLREAPAKGSRVHLSLKSEQGSRRRRVDGKVVWKKGLECGIQFENLRGTPNNEKLLFYMGDRMCEFVVKSAGSNLVALPVTTLTEHKAAYRLMYREYLARGYCAKHASKMYYTSYSLLPTSRTFILKQQKHLIGTLSLFVDSPCGLPMDHTAPEVTGQLRFQGRRVAEASLLALDPNAFREGTPPLTYAHRLAGSFWLFKTLLDYARQIADVTDLVVTVHPNHEHLYRNLAFKSIKPATPYVFARGHLGLPMHLDVRELEAHLPVGTCFKKFFFDNLLPLDQLAKTYRWTPVALSDFINKRQAEWPQMMQGAVEWLKRRYPLVAARTRQKSHKTSGLNDKGEPQLSFVGI
ncbi:MAG: PilZ domain-containing protein [Candidatus Omnitrophota bacterium]|nr:PilZ domain-containing protein [Candidatus Omnitrophota bacterium]